MSEPLDYHNPSYAGQVQSLEQEVEEIYPPDPRLTRVALGCLALGMLGFLIGIFYAPGRTFGAFTANFLFWVGLAQGAIVVAATFTTALARWGRVIQRMIEALGAFLVFSPLLFIVLWLGRYHLFAWLGQPDRSPWLNEFFLLFRDELVLLVMTGLSLWWLYRSIRPDLRKLAKGAPGDKFQAWLTRDWRGERLEKEWTAKVLQYLGPAIIIGFCWGYGMLSIDLSMTVDPRFKSTMFPGIYWASEFLAPLALGTILVWAWRRKHPTVARVITESTVLDLGNMVWGFAIFRTWFDWSQYIIIWYANLPDEAGYLYDRWRVSPWNWMAYASLGCVFILPFFLGFSRRLKKNPNTVIILGGLVALGILSRQFVDVMPSIPDLGPFDLGLIELAITVGFAGAVALPYLWLLRRVPLFPVSDPLFIEALETRGTPET